MSDDPVKRWEPYTDEGNYYNYGNMEECSDGYYIEYQDYKDAADHIEELEAKLAKAVEALSYYSNHEILFQYDDASLARTTLAELKGQE